MTNEHEQHLAVLGSPIAHSQSPRIHLAAYEELGLPWGYRAIECDVPQLAELLRNTNDTWRGFSVTMPLKEEAFRLCAIRDQISTESGVVNTLLRLAGDAGWAGFNSDVPGLAAALREQHLNARHTVVFGAGATAVSAVLAAKELGAETITVLARRTEAANALALRFECQGATFEVDDEVIEDASLVISTLPASAGADVVIPQPLLRTPLYDVAYADWPTPLATRWVATGASASSGITMLLHQALLQVRIFVNGDPSLPVQNEHKVFEAMKQAVS